MFKNMAFAPSGAGRRRIIWACCLLFLTWAASVEAIVYVDKDRAGGNGTSWQQAYKTLEAAINNTTAVEEFWIAEGTYTPPAILFLTRPGYSFYGGFAGNETARSQRNIAKHLTIVDGGTHNLLHVFYAVTNVKNVRFDGLIIQGGSATGSADHASGGGVLVNEGAVVIANCTFRDNRAAHLGGAVYLVNNPSVTIINSRFIRNTILGPGGGGAGVALTRSLVSSVPAAARIEKSSFHKNSGGSEGGGLYSLHYPVIVAESTFTGNSAVHGGAIMLDYKLAGPDKIERCLFSGNTATTRGGAIASFARSVEVENSVFAYNSSSNGGGGVGLHSGYIDGNLSYYNEEYLAEFRNSTFYSNSAGVGGGIENIGGHRMFIYNSIFWGNEGLNTYYQDGVRLSHDVANHNGKNDPSTMEMQYTDMETWGLANGPVAVNAVGNFSADPLFVDPDGADNTAGTADDNLSIRDSSPCIDRADGDNAPPTDIVFRARYDHPSAANLGAGTPDYADIGAYEGPYTPPVNVPEPVVPDGVSLPPLLYLLL